MSTYQEKLRELTQDAVVSQLEGADGLLALTRAELFYIGKDGVQRAVLSEIKKVVGGKGGTLVVMGETAPLIEAPVRSFQVDELRLFFESVKAFVAREKQGAAPPPPPPPPPAPAARPAAASETAEEPMTLEDEPAPVAPPVRPTPTAEIYAPEPVTAPAPRRTGGLAGALLKLFSLATLGAAGYWVYMNPAADLTNLIFVGVLGLGVALVEWRASNL